MEYTQFFESPIGFICVKASPTGITSVSFCKEKSNENHNDITIKACEQLRLYFEGKLMEFSLPLDYWGTPFRMKAWKAMQRIPYGKTISYKEQALIMGSDKGYRAVGNANGKNPIGIIIPCHRVVKSDGGLGGYTGGIHYKEWLLSHEKKHST